MRESKTAVEKRASLIIKYRKLKLIEKRRKELKQPTYFHEAIRTPSSTA
jgi:hypothetical protein